VPPLRILTTEILASIDRQNELRASPERSGVLSMSGITYLARRVLLAALVLLGVLLITFVVSHVVPGDPARLYAGSRAGEAALAEVRRELGLDQPLPRQFLRYVLSSTRGDFGYSYRTKRPILEDLKARLPATLELVILATLLAIVAGVPTGVLAAARFGTRLDRLVRVISIAGVSMPAFWLALLLQLFFFLWLGWLPLGGRVGLAVSFTNPIAPITGFDLVDAALTLNWVAWRDAAWHAVLPAVVLATFPYSLVVRMTRASMLEVLSETYVSAARAAET
jgi:peptide/nickel transport system permease protein